MATEGNEKTAFEMQAPSYPGQTAPTYPEYGGPEGQPAPAYPGYGGPEGQPVPAYPGYGGPEEQPAPAYPGFGGPEGQPAPAYPGYPNGQPAPAYPGYGAPQGQPGNPGYGAPQGQPASANPVYGQLGETSTRTFCNNCHNEVNTRVRDEISVKGWIWGVVCCCFLGCYLFACFIFCFPGFKKYTHTCPNCNAIIGVVEPELSGSHKCIIIGSVVFYIVFIILMIALYVGGAFWAANNTDDFNYHYNYGK